MKKHVREPIGVPIEEHVAEPVEEPIEKPVKEPAEKPVEEPIEEPIEEAVEEPARVLCMEGNQLPYDHRHHLIWEMCALKPFSKL